ncbi:MAG: tetratricopeptide repeat protein [Myxococcota bacterium]|nr:tetratricopeptide repeat protein [Myxococcota bacterium]
MSRLHHISPLALVSAVIATILLAGCPDQLKMANDHLRDEGYMELELTPKDGATNAFMVKGSKDGKPCKGSVTVMSMPGSSSATFNTDIVCKAPKAPAPKKEDPLAKDRAACKGGDLKVCVKVGQALMTGGVGSRDPEGAAKLFAQACDGKEQSGCVQLGILHTTGLGIEKSEDKAAALFTKACEAGDMLGCARQGKLHYINRKGKSALALTTKACEGGSVEGCHYLGMLYLEGIGVKQKLSQARKYFQGACDGEWLEACTMLGIMLSKGDGGSKNVSRAKEVLGFACERKFQNACYHLKKL